MRPKKSLGQNFLTSIAARDAMTRAAKLSRADFVLEIGPGKGFLTEALLEQSGKMLAIEKDDALFAFLQEKFAAEISAGRLELIHGDILDLFSNINNLIPKTFKLIANIPYYLTGEIIRAFLEAKNQPSLMVLMLQKEVAERIIAKDGKESLLSISVKVFGEPKYVQIVRAGSFFPKPKVDSAILAIENIRPMPRSHLDSKKFFKILRRGFAHKRKLLKSNLACSTEILTRCKIEATARAENLNLNQWLCLDTNLPQLKNGIGLSLS